MTILDLGGNAEGREGSERPRRRIVASRDADTAAGLRERRATARTIGAAIAEGLGGDGARADCVREPMTRRQLLTAVGREGSEPLKTALVANDLYTTLGLANAQLGEEEASPLPRASRATRARALRVEPLQPPPQATHLPLSLPARSLSSDRQPHPVAGTCSGST